MAGDALTTNRADRAAPRRRCRRCAIVAALLALLLALVLLPLMKSSVDRGLRKDARAALAAAGVSGVQVESSWAKLRLTGPASARAAALEAAAGMPHASAVDTTTYVVAGGDGAASATEPSTKPTTTAAPAPVRVAVAAELSADAGTRAVRLTGTVATEEQHQAIVQAAAAAYGEGNVTDEITVGTGAADPGDEAGLTQFGALLGAFGADVATGTVRLDAGALSVDATGRDAAATSAANAAIAAAEEAGADITGQVVAPASTGAKAPAAVERQVAAAVRLRGVTFDTGSARLTPAATVVLDRVAAILRKAGTLDVSIAGHTDDEGDSGANQRLSKARADAVKAYLAAHGVAGRRMTTTGYGESRPIASNGTEAGRRTNRRISFKVTRS